MKKRIRSLVFCALGVAVLVALDRWTKLLVTQYLRSGARVQVIPGLLDLIYLENYGAAFGILQNKTLFFVVMTAVAVALFVALLIFYPHHTPLTLSACVLIIAGGVGNMIDRIMHAYVVDFICLSFFPPVFNLADCCAVIGTVLVLVYMLFSMGKTPKEPAAAAPNKPAGTEPPDTPDSRG